MPPPPPSSISCSSASKRWRASTPAGSGHPLRSKTKPSPRSAKACMAVLVESAAPSRSSSTMPARSRSTVACKPRVLVSARKNARRNCRARVMCGISPRDGQCAVVERLAVLAAHDRNQREIGLVGIEMADEALGHARWNEKFVVETVGPELLRTEQAVGAGCRSGGQAHHERRDRIDLGVFFQIELQVLLQPARRRDEIRTGVLSLGRAEHRATASEHALK